MQYGCSFHDFEKCLIEKAAGMVLEEYGEQKASPFSCKWVKCKRHGGCSACREHHKKEKKHKKHMQRR